MGRAVVDEGLRVVPWCGLGISLLGLGWSLDSLL